MRYSVLRFRIVSEETILEIEIIFTLICDIFEREKEIQVNKRGYSC